MSDGCACTVCGASSHGMVAITGVEAPLYRSLNDAIHGRLFGRRASVFRDSPRAHVARPVVAGDVVRSTRFPELFWIEGGGDPGPGVEHADGARVLRLGPNAANAGAVS